MARPRSLPDADVYAAILQLLAVRGEDAVAFSSVARATGLAPATLVQRYGNRAGMIRAAILSAWDALDAALAAAADDTPHGLLKSLGAAMPDPAILTASLRDPETRARAEGWRVAVQAGIAARLGGGAKGDEGAAILFAAWQGDLLWRQAGGKGFRLKDAAKRIG
jgi:AcrR family transcriptional regulator